jgi:hypothetical protein
MVAEIQKDRGTHEPEDLDQLIVERAALLREIKRLVPEWNQRKRDGERD